MLRHYLPDFQASLSFPGYFSNDILSLIFTGLCVSLPLIFLLTYYAYNNIFISLLPHFCSRFSFLLFFFSLRIFLYFISSFPFLSLWEIFSYQYAYVTPSLVPHNIICQAHIFLISFNYVINFLRAINTSCFHHLVDFNFSELIIR